MSKIPESFGRQSKWKPVKLEKMLGSQNKKILDELYLFCRAFEKYEKNSQGNFVKKKKNIVRNPQVFKSFTTIEDQALEYRVHQFLYKLNSS